MDLLVVADFIDPEGLLTPFEQSLDLLSEICFVFVGTRDSRHALDLAVDPLVDQVDALRLQLLTAPILVVVQFLFEGGTHFQITQL